MYKMDYLDLDCPKCGDLMTLERSRLGRELDEEEWYCEECDLTLNYTATTTRTPNFDVSEFKTRM